MAKSDQKVIFSQYGACDKTRVFSMDGYAIAEKYL